MKELKNNILDILYEIREGEVEEYYLAKNKEPKELKKKQKAEEELTEFMKRFIKNEKDVRNLLEKLNNYELDSMGEMLFWFRQYYKRGFLDGIHLKNEIDEGQITTKNCENSIIYRNMEETFDFIEDQKYKNLKSNDEYNRILMEISEIEKKFPRVQDFLWDEKVEKFTKEEMMAILDIIELYNIKAMYEGQEMFRIGVKEGANL